MLLTVKEGQSEHAGCSVSNCQYPVPSCLGGALALQGKRWEQSTGTILFQYTSPHSMIYSCDDYIPFGTSWLWSPVRIHNVETQALAWYKGKVLILL